ncbi:MAG: phosphatase PAP2 family protein [Planctomycetes bacterium]|nr:phosphatase PAP2 family protein [Planctomycetota bacterium]
MPCDPVNMTARECPPAQVADGMAPDAELQPDRLARRWTPVALLLLLAGMALLIDLDISRHMVDQDWAQPWQRIRKVVHNVLEAVEPFGQPTAVICVSLAIVFCAGPKRGAGFRIAAGALCSGLFADLLKTTVARVRPRNFDFAGTVTSTFRNFLPGSGGGSPIQSWPSAHTAMAVGFCLALSSVFPRGRVLFYTLAAMVAMQRIETGAHYLSDTLSGAAVGYAVWMIVFVQGPIARYFDADEIRWARR